MKSSLRAGTDKVKGKVKWFKEKQGYGFIQPDADPNAEVFVHKSAIRGTPTLWANDIVEYLVEMGSHGASAIEVEVISR
ncbi:MAG: cold shock domain-containing protein [Chloroflexota bacterium]